jgi:hypothetical protein
MWLDATIVRTHSNDTPYVVIKVACGGYCGVPPNICHTVSTLTLLITLPFYCPVWCAARDEVRNLKAVDVKCAASSRMSRGGSTNGGMLIDRTKAGKFGEKCTPGPFHPPRISHKVTWYLNRGSAWEATVWAATLMQSNIKMYFFFLHRKLTVLPLHSPVG